MTTEDRQRFAEELERWAQRPTRLSPQAARARVEANLTPERKRSTWRLAAAGATLAASLLVLLLLFDRQSGPVAISPTATAAGQQTIVHQLSSGTRLYIVVRPDPAARHRPVQDPRGGEI